MSTLSVLGLQCKSTMPFLNKQTDKIYEAIDADYDLVERLLPSLVTNFEFDDGVSLLEQLLSGNFAASSATAIHGNGVLLVKFSHGALQKVFAFYVNIQARRDATFGMLFGGAHVNELHVGIGNNFVKLFYTDRSVSGFGL